SRPGSYFSAEAGFSRRTNEPHDEQGGSATRSDLAHTILSWSPRQHRLRAEWRYEIGDEGVRTLQQVLVLAPDGHGDYDAEGRPAGKDQGLYDRVLRFASEPERVVSVESSLRLELGGVFAGIDTSASWLRRNVSLVQVLGVKEQTRSDRRRDLYLLVP